MKKFVLVFIFLIPFISAVCEVGQIDINVASLDELMEIKWLGGTGVIAQRVIDDRPFNSLADLTRVSGLGGTGARLESIKQQELACVGSEQTEQDVEVLEEQEEEIEEQEEVVEILEIETIQETKPPIKIENEVINLAPQNIKSEDYTENKPKSDYALYGLFGFCILLGGLFTIRKNKLRKNEFR